MGLTQQRLEEVDAVARQLWRWTFWESTMLVCGPSCCSYKIPPLQNQQTKTKNQLRDVNSVTREQCITNKVDSWFDRIFA